MIDDNNNPNNVISPEISPENKDDIIKKDTIINGINLYDTNNKSDTPIIYILNKRFYKRV
jgi:hypothetical protein